MIYLQVTIKLQCSHFNLDPLHISKTLLNFTVSVFYIFYSVPSQLGNVEIEGILSILRSSKPKKEHSLCLLDTPLLKNYLFFLFLSCFCLSISQSSYRAQYINVTEVLYPRGVGGELGRRGDPSQLLAHNHNIIKLDIQA